MKIYSILCMMLFLESIDAFMSTTPVVRMPSTVHQSAPSVAARALSPTSLLQSKDDDITTSDTLVQSASRVLKRTSWLSWWSQVILSSISAVILVFSKTTSAASSNFQAPNFFWSGAGVLTSLLSIVWTWGNGARLSRRLLRATTSRTRAARLMRRAVQVGVTLNLVGLLITLVAAEEIVGTLAIKVLTNRNMIGMAEFSAGALQPLDILIVQANTNSLLSHFCSLASLLYLTDRIRQLDPPRSETEE